MACVEHSRYLLQIVYRTEKALSICAGTADSYKVDAQMMTNGRSPAGLGLQVISNLLFILIYSCWDTAEDLMSKNCMGM